METNLFDYGMSWEEPDLQHLGDLYLSYDDACECGRWAFWQIAIWLSNDYALDDFHAHPWMSIDLPSLHWCEEGDTEGCVQLEFPTDGDIRIEDYDNKAWWR